MIILSQHLVPRDSEFPAVPPKFRIFWGGTVKKIFGANAPTPSPQKNLHQVSANANDTKMEAIQAVSRGGSKNLSKGMVPTFPSPPVALPFPSGFPSLVPFFARNWGGALSMAESRQKTNLVHLKAVRKPPVTIILNILRTVFYEFEERNWRWWRHNTVPQSWTCIWVHFYGSNSNPIHFKIEGVKSNS